MCIYRVKQTKLYKDMKKIIGSYLVLICMAAALCGCSAEMFDIGPGGLSEKGAMAEDGSGFFDGDGSGGEGNGGEQSFHSGVVTAGEWNDIANWGYWANLLNNQEWAQYAEYWKYYPHNFVYVKLSDESGNPVCGVNVALEKDGQKVWSAISDNSGTALLWASLYESKYGIEESDYSLKVAGTAVDEFEFTTAGKQEAVVNNYMVQSYMVQKPSPANAIDVAFIVDATGSMGDEIDFLKEDLKDIIDLVGTQCTANVRTATVFYRDEGDRYVTKHSNFTDKLSETVAYIGEQTAEGGGDWPEAVHKALAEGIQSLQWNPAAKSRVAFLILDAPPHHEDDIIASCQKSIEAYAMAGIKVVPVAASGIDKACEYLLRNFAMATNGTYVFITNDSGVGNEHIEATVGDYKVEKLRDLIARLIIAYAK